MKLFPFRALVVGLTALPLAAQKPAAPATGVDELYNVGKQLFDQLAPPEVKAQFEFPSKEQWDAFAARLQHALESDSLKDLADLLPEARAALIGLRTLPGYEEYADWLEQRIDEIEATQGLLSQ